MYDKILFKEFAKLFTARCDKYFLLNLSDQENYPTISSISHPEQMRIRLCLNSIAHLSTKEIR